MKSKYPRCMSSRMDPHKSIMPLFALFLSTAICSFPVATNFDGSASLACHAFVKPNPGINHYTNNQAEAVDTEFPSAIYTSGVEASNAEELYQQLFETIENEGYWCNYAAASSNKI